MKTKSLLCAIHIVGVAVIFSATVTALFAQDFTIHMKGDNGVDGTTYYVSANAIRRTTPGISEVIDRMDRGTIIYLNHRNRSYQEIPAAEARAKIADGMNNIDPQKKAMPQQYGLDKPAQLTKIGPGENIAGYATDRRQTCRSPRSCAETHHDRIYGARDERQPWRNCGFHRKRRCTCIDV